LRKEVRGFSQKDMEEVQKAEEGNGSRERGRCAAKTRREKTKEREIEKSLQMQSPICHPLPVLQ
jgi:hypothetical protein